MGPYALDPDKESLFGAVILHKPFAFIRFRSPNTPSQNLGQPVFTLWGIFQIYLFAIFGNVTDPHDGQILPDTLSFRPLLVIHLQPPLE